MLQVRKKFMRPFVWALSTRQGCELARVWAKKSALRQRLWPRLAGAEAVLGGEGQAQARSGGALSAETISSRARRRGRRRSRHFGSDRQSGVGSFVFDRCTRNAANRFAWLGAPPAPWVRANQATRASSSPSGAATSDSASVVRMARAGATSVRIKQRCMVAGGAAACRQHTRAISRRNSASRRSTAARAGMENMAAAGGGLQGEGPLGA